MDRSKQLGEGNVLSLLLKFSIPAVVGMMVNGLYNVVDRIFIGQGVGSLAIAGIAIGFPIMTIIMAFGMLIGIGATALISIRLGERNKDEAELIAANAFTLLIIISALLTLFGLIFLDPMLKFFGASPDVLPYAKNYLRIILWGSAFQGISFGMNSFIRAEGNPLMAMATMFIGAFLNILLDPIFIFVFKMGVSGAALATIIAQAVSAAWVLFYFLSARSSLKLKIKNLSIRPTIALKIFAIGSAPFSMQIAASALIIILNNSLARYGGDKAISAFGIINSLSLLILMPIFGINQGSQPIIGYNYGAGNFKRVKEALKLAIIAATTIVLIGFIGTTFFSKQLIMMFNSDDPELIEMGSKALRGFLMFFPIIGFQIVSSNYFQAVGKPKKSMLLSLSRQVLFLIPAVIILPIFFGMDGIIAAGPVSDFCSSILTTTLLFFELRHLDEKHLDTLRTA